MIVETPFPDDIASHIYFHDGVHLGVRVIASEGRRGITTGGNTLVRTDCLVGNVECGEGIQFSIEDAREVVVH